MTLKEQIEKLIPQNINVKIGSACQFLYCGKCNKSTLKLIAKISKNYYSNLSKKIEELEHYLADFDEFWDNKIERLLKDYNGDDLFEYKEKLTLSRNDDLSNKQRYFNKLLNQKNNFTPFLQRKVITIYDSDPFIEENCKIIIFKGIENGSYWTIEEYKKGNKIK